MRTQWLPALLTLSLSTPALATGVDIAWDNCLGEPGAVSLKSFACGTNAGQETMWISFESSQFASSMGRLEVAIQFQTRSGVALPVWWDFEDFASCRHGALSVDPEAPFETATCARVFTSVNPPTFVVDRIDYQLPTPDVGRMVVAANLSGPLLANQRYLACRFLLKHIQTSACAGCSELASVTVTALRIANMIITTPITQNTALWQTGATATRATSWSALKRMYR
jgi:hypothetical protein